MHDLRVKLAFLVLNNVVYYAMLVLGFYFIYKGDVVQRFMLKRANFAAYEAPITELPTIITWIYPYKKNINFGEDFKLYFSSRFGSEKESEVTLGENLQRVNDIEFGFHFSKYYQGFSALKRYPNLYKITPRVEIIPSTPLEWMDDTALNLRFVYTNASKMSGVQFGLLLSTENNTASCKGKHFDGDVEFVNAEPNTSNRLTVFAKKYIYLTDTRKCRHRPYSEMLIEHMHNNINFKCAMPCKPDNLLSSVLLFA